MASESDAPEVVEVDELGPLMVVGEKEGVDVAKPDHRYATHEESLQKRQDQLKFSTLAS